MVVELRCFYTIISPGIRPIAPGTIGTGAIGQGDDVRGACVRGGHLSGAFVRRAFVPAAIGLEPSYLPQHLKSVVISKNLVMALNRLFHEPFKYEQINA